MNPAGDLQGRSFAIAADHAGVSLKNEIVSNLKERGAEVSDLGTHSTDSVDYPDFAERVASAVSRGEVKEGILICGTGIGMSMTANRFPGVRAALVTTPFMAEMARAHNDANVLCLGARLLEASNGWKLVETWLQTSFEGKRHERRVNKIMQFDRPKKS